MYVSLKRFIGQALCLAVFAAPAAHAQVTLHLTTPTQTSCNATTDAQGLNLIPGGTDLQASGVTFSGNGCGAGGGTFAANVSVPGTSTVGTPFNVTWSASADATLCTYGGSAGLSGWPTGTNACQGAACGTSHVVAVTPTTAGSFNLSVTCTNNSGFAQGATTAANAPTAPQPPNFALNAPASVAAGAAFQVSWAVTGATSCTGSASLGGSSVSLPGWTDSTSIVSPRTVTAATAGTYTLNLACSNPVGTTNSAPATVVVGGSADNCPSTPLTRITSSSISYVPSGVPPTRTGVNLASYDEIWGHANATDTTVTWPGRSNSQPTILSFLKTGYIAAKFHVPAGVSPTLYGWISHTDYNYGQDLTSAISTACGDFNPTDTRCVVSQISGQTLVRWGLSAPSFCPLLPNTDYFLNIKMTDPSRPSSTCSASATVCAIGTSNNIGGQ